jgi:NAD(P)-dependent dehydrogenase (short-subunit alcohol dehydrogenase family)
MQTVLITGVSKGIGRALAEKFLAEGHNVMGTTTTGSADYSDTYSQKNLRIFQLELTDPKSIAACAQAIGQACATVDTKIDILINNAGALLDEDETHVVIDKLHQTLEVNLIGPIDFTERIIPFMNTAVNTASEEKQSGYGSHGGHIISMSSQAGSLQEMDHIMDSHYPYHYPAYKISKCAINMYTRTLAVRLSHEKTGIIVSSTHPGWVKTDMGGDEAPTTPADAAEHIYQLAISRPETGQFWFEGKKYPW